jgi:hypothetical protein
MMLRDMFALFWRSLWINGGVKSVDLSMHSGNLAVGNNRVVAAVC